MNWQFYDFWGNYFLQVAQGQKKMEDFAQWMKQGFNNLNDMAELFQRSYGLKAQKSGGDEGLRNWKNAIDEFQDACTQLAAQWGWISLEEHKKVVEKCAALEEKIEDQKKMIEQLRDLLTQKGMGHTELFKHLQDALKEQSTQFHELMRTISGTDEK